MPTPSGTGTDATTAGVGRAHPLTTRVSIAVLVITYLALALTFTLLTRAYEADDEAAHTEYVEYVVQHHSIPHIGVSDGGESHQPPLYYVLVAGWQELLGIPAFTPQVTLAKQPVGPNRLVLSHDYTASQHKEAVDLHELRLLSVLFGLGTVLFTYAGARVVGLREPIALCSGLFVAVLPRALVLTTDVTNDALIIPLCALALLLFLLAERARSEGRPGRRRLHLLGMGLVLGAGAVTKFSGLPVAGILLVLAFVPSITRSGVPAVAVAANSSDHVPTVRVRWVRVDLHAVVDGVAAVAGFLAVSGWWFVRNKELYGQFLASNRSEAYLRSFLGGAHPVPWGAHLLFVQVPQVFLDTSWYGQPDLSLPMPVNDILAGLGLLCLASGAWVMLVERRHQWLTPHKLYGLALLGCIAGGLAAVIINIKTTSIGDARVAFVGLAAFAMTVVVGTTRPIERFSPRWAPVGPWAWPAVLVGLDLYVIFRFLIPLGGL